MGNTIEMNHQIPYKVTELGRTNESRVKWRQEMGRCQRDESSDTIFGDEGGRTNRCEYHGDRKWVMPKG